MLYYKASSISLDVQDEEIPLVSIDDFRNYAEQHMDPPSFLYFEGGATEESTILENVAAYRRYRLLPNVLVNVSAFSPSVSVFGRTYDVPFGVAPVAFQTAAHPRGENASVSAAHAYNTIFTLSSHATTTIEELAETAPEVTKWMQIYPWGIRDETLYFIRRAETAGFSGIVVTADRSADPIMYDRKRGLSYVPSNVSSVNFSNSTDEYQMALKSSSMTWEEIAWIRSQTELPVLAKGVLHPDDVARATAAGVDGVIVSNHGGRLERERERERERESKYPASRLSLGSVLYPPKWNLMPIF